MHKLKGSIVFVGDIHGEPHNVCYNFGGKFPPPDHVIFLGDIGLGFDIKGCAANSDEMMLRIRLRHIRDSVIPNCKPTTKIWLIRGNHDKMTCWYPHHRESYWDPIGYGAWTRTMETLYKEFPEITFLRDEVISLNGHYALCIGGGVSIDKCFRKKHSTWWPGEEIIGYQRFKHYWPENCKKKIDIILAHTGPKPYCLVNKSMPFYWNQVLKTTKKALAREERMIERYISKFKPKLWIHGHFHVNAVTTISLPGEEVKGYCVTENCILPFDAVTRHL